MAGGVALNLQRINQLLKRHVLIRLGLGNHCVGLFNQRFHAAGRLKLRPQDQRVNKHPNQRLGLRMMPVVGRGSQHNIVLAGQFRQRDIKRTEQNGIQGGFLRFCQRP